MAIVRRDRKNTLIWILTISAVTTLVLGLLGSGTSYGPMLADRLAVAVGAFGLAAVLVTLFQELTDRIAR